ncbi:DUF4145 domain-containing protein [Kosakonia cowanii]|uniref:DUF4145 domain-containing protein n=1 Tax=Kosakonia cowanii TaxID=208223 RepID=UPI00272FFB75|nr:DUF4145 domain-containing protein [Kosakonia cowanii]WKW40790.1 DUF4145 domain-containing protein [Kosakonia cowanii]
MSAWKCPFCGMLSVHEKIEKKYDKFVAEVDSKYGEILFQSYVHVCPNPECKEFSYHVIASSTEWTPQGYQPINLIEKWQNRPQGIIKNYPPYIPEAILSDYKEAALIRDLSPKAAATLARRCLQGMIRDFWTVKEKNLFEEIKAIEDKVDSDTWAAIDAIRSIGNIGAHMEKDIDLIIDVDSEEAGMLISLIETLLSDWYVQRENRRQRSLAIVEIANHKKEQRSSNNIKPMA